MTSITIGNMLKCLGVPTVDMKGVCTQLEDKTFGKIIHRHGGLLVLYRGRNYNPKQRPVIPLMLWKPQEPVYLRLIKTVIDGLSIEKTKEMRKRGLAVPVLTKLAKNGYYASLVPMVRDAFLTKELVRIDCQGLERSDYEKIGCKLWFYDGSLFGTTLLEMGGQYLLSRSLKEKDLVPCVLVTFEKEQIVVCRGKDYKLPEDGSFLMHREMFDDSDNDLVSSTIECRSSGSSDSKDNRDSKEILVFEDVHLS
ncbi:hypothetical protein RJ641_016870 [Dillenia turbinata]|uniref:CRM domain-containing protein n=1 Tax=Dillenia turbinata TaxID=194707 RepID=A0AAN8UZ71_9MAGN